MSSRASRPQQHPHLGTLWSHRDFRKLWAGETVSLLGSQVTMLALPLTAVVLLKATPLQMGILNAAEFAPFLFVTLLVGIWVNHKRRRPILIIANLGRAFLLALVPLLAWPGSLHMVALVGIALLAGVFTVCFQLAYEAYLPRLVPPDQLVEGNSKLSVSSSFAELAGPGLAGVLVQVMTAPFAMLVDACSFLVSAASLLVIRTPETALSLPANPLPLHREISAGFRINLENRYLRAFAGEAATYNLFWQVTQVIFILYAVRVLHLNALTIGLIFAVGSVGALLSAGLTERLTRRFGVGRIMIGAQMLSDVTTYLIPLTALIGSTTGVIICLMGAFFLRGGGNTACNVQVNSVRQVITPDRLRGSANAAYRLLVSGAIALGALLGGVLGGWIGLPLTLLVGAVGTSCSWLWLLCSPLARLRQLPVPVDEAPPSR